MTETIFSPQDALIAVMIATSAADEKLTESELSTIERLVGVLPAFRGYDIARIPAVFQAVFDIFEDEDGIDNLVSLIEAALPEGLNETAYALACDVAAADGTADQPELRFLEILRQDLEVGRLTAAAIEHGARARHPPHRLSAPG